MKVAPGPGCLRTAHLNLNKSDSVSLQVQKRPLRLCLVISSLGAGGAERVMSTLANAWAERGYEISCITTVASTGEDFYSIDPQVKRIRLNVPAEKGGRGIFLSLKRVLRLRGVFRAQRPDLIISFIDKSNIFTLIAAKGAGVPVIARERIDPYQGSIGGGVWEVMRRRTYPWAACVTVLTDAVAERFLADHPRLRLAVLANPLPEELIQRFSCQRPRGVVGDGC